MFYGPFPAYSAPDLPKIFRSKLIILACYIPIVNSSAMKPNIITSSIIVTIIILSTIIITLYDIGSI